jgi:hypothetical protein
MGCIVGYLDCSVQAHCRHEIYKCSIMPSTFSYWPFYVHHAPDSSYAFPFLTTRH